MARALEFVVPGIPQPMQRPRVGANGQMYTPRKTLGFEHAVAAQALRAMSLGGWSQRGKERYAVSLVAYFPDARRRDIDNVLKSVLDGCTPLVWADDSQVDSARIERGLDARNPRVEVWISVLGGEVGVNRSAVDGTLSSPNECGDARKTEAGHG